MRDDLGTITDDLVRDLAGLRFGARVAYVYNPLVYARAPWDAYCARFGSAPREAVLFGMNPGPFGMAQTGVPFGQVEAVRGWLGVEAPVGRPPAEHPKRPITGFACARSEVSGARLWGWARSMYHTPEAFFARFFVANYCPLVFMGEGGENVTPDKLPAAERAALFAACDKAARRTLAHFQPRVAIGVGAFAEGRLRAVVDAAGLPVEVARVPHPSPASPAANRGWDALMTQEIARLGLAPADGSPPDRARRPQFR